MGARAGLPGSLIETPPAAPAGVVSPTSAAALLRCPLQFAYRSGASARGRPPASRAAALGSVCHEVLAEIARTRPDPDGDWRGTFDALWQQATLRNVPAALGDPAEWPFHDRRKAAARRIGRELAAELQNESIEAFPEHTLSAFGGRLAGRADLVLRGEKHEIRDYKTGSAPGGEAKDLQLLLYAVMEATASGEFPDRLAYIPFRGAPVDASHDPRAAVAALEAVEEALASYNASAGRNVFELGRPGTAQCSWCPAFRRCPVAWDSLGDSWQPESGAAAAGEITGAQLVAPGLYRIDIRVVGGSATAEHVSVHRLGTWQIEGCEPAPGCEAAVTGLEVTATTEFVAGERTVCRVVAASETSCCSQ